MNPISPKKSSTEIPPLVDLQVTNPVTYIKLWWKKVMGNEGIEIKLKIHPITAVLLTLIILGGTFSVGFIVSALRQVPGIAHVIPPEVTPTPSPDPWKDTAYTGVLRETAGRFYLVTSDAEAITLDVPENVNLKGVIGKRILAVGKQNRITGVLQVIDADDLELLIQSAPIIVNSPSPTLEPTPSFSPES